MVLTRPRAHPAQLRSAGKVVSGSAVGTGVAVYLAAVAVNAQVEDRADWWPYSWLWLLLVAAALSAAVWVYLMVTPEGPPGVRGAVPSAPVAVDRVGEVMVEIASGRRPRRWALLIALFLGVVGFLLMVVGFALYVVDPPLSQTSGATGLFLLMAAVPVALVAYIAQLVRWVVRKRGRVVRDDRRSSETD
jgi:hypothetical protein